MFRRVYTLTAPAGRQYSRFNCISCRVTSYCSLQCLRLFQLGTCPAVLAKAAHFRSARLDALDADDILFTPRV